MMRMAFRYSDLMTHDPQCDEVAHMSNNFGGYWESLGQSGYGISIYPQPRATDYTPDKWYNFEL